MNPFFKKWRQNVCGDERGYYESKGKVNTQNILEHSVIMFARARLQNWLSTYYPLRVLVSVSVISQLL